MGKKLSVRIGKLEEAPTKQDNYEERIMATLSALSRIYGDGLEPKAMDANDFNAMVIQKIYEVCHGASQCQ